MSQTATETASTTTQTTDKGQGTTQTTSAATEPYFKSWLQSDGTLSAAALDRLPDHLKDLRPTLERQKTLDDVLVVMKNQQVLSGKKALAPLPPGSPPEAIAERKALLDGINGVPKEAKDYGITRPADLPENLWSQKMADKYSAWAHKYSVSPAAAKELMGENLGIIREQLAEQANYETQFYAKESQKFEEIARTENIPLDRAQAMIDKAVIAFGLDPKDPQTERWLKSANTKSVLMRHAIAIGEDRTITGNAGTGASTQSYKEQADSIRRDPANPLNAAFRNEGGKYSRDDHEAAVARWQELLRLDEEQRSKKERGR